MAETQQVIIEFITKDEQLDSSVDKLEKAGAIDAELAAAFKQTTAEINKQATEMKKVATATAPIKKNLEDVNKATKTFTQDFMTGFNEGVIETLKEAGVSVEQFTEALKTGQTEVQEPAESLRQRLKVLTQQIAEMKLAGEDGTEQFRALVIEAGNIKDAMADAGAEIRNAGSDTRTFDNLLGSAQAVAGGFAVAQGAVALFGEENKDLEKTMLKVNAAIAVTQGLQSISAALEKEGALSLLATNIQLKVKNAQKIIENGLESQSIVVRGGAIIAQKALNAAMAANPIGIVVVALAGLITLLGTYGRNAAEARRQTTNLNVALGQGAKGYEGRIEAAKRTEEAEVANLENIGATDSRISELRLENERKIANITKERLEELRQAKANNAEADLEKRRQVDDEISRLEDQVTTDIIYLNDLEFQQKKKLREEDLKNTIAGLEAQLSTAEEGSKQQLDIQRRLIAAKTALELNADGLLTNERKAIAEKGRQEEEEAVAAANKRSIDLQLAAIDTQLINVKEGSEEELQLKKKQIDLQTQAELTSTKLSEAEKLQIKEDGFQKQLKIQKDYNARVRREAIEAQISLNDAQIAQLQTNDQDRLILQIANIELAAAAEVDAAKGNSAKIKEINAKRDADILAVRKKFIDDAAQYEIDLRTAENGSRNRALQRIINDERKGLEARKVAIKSLATEQIKNIDTLLAALEEEKNKKLISEKDYILKYAQLQDKKREITEESEKATTDLIKAENIERANIAFNVLNQIADIISGINEIQAEQQNQRIEGERQRVAELLEAGAITEAEAAKRNKRLDVEEKKARRQQAQREKDIATFKAFLAIPQAFLTGLTQGGPVLGAIYAALAAAQAVVIASRPLPRFGHGKKSGYEGPAEIGETGPELYEQNGRMHLADKKQLVWLAAKDKVYNPIETKEILMPVVDKEVMQWKPVPQNKVEIDYERLAKAVGKHINIPGFNIDEHGFKIWQQEGISRKNYMDKRYSSK